MIAMTIRLDDGSMPEAGEAQARGQLIHLSNDASPIIVSGLEGGMASGAPSVALGIELPDRTFVLAETSLRLFLMAADALRARYGDPRG